MRKIYLLFLNFFKHYRRFKFNGIVFLYKKRFMPNQIISFKASFLKFPVFLRNNSSDISTFYQIVFYQEYKIAFGFIPEIIIDLGANIGLAAVYFKNVYPNSKIISLEPEISNYNMLLKNTKEYDDIICYNVGIWNKPGNLIVEESEQGYWASFVHEVEYISEDTTKAITISQLIRDHKIDKIDILKIDIEGSEKELFSNNYNEWLSITKVIIIELHDHLREGSSMSFFNALSKYNYSISHSGENILCFLNKNL